MAKIPLTPGTLAKLGDGLAGKALEAALDVVQKDILDRGDDGKARSVTLKLTFTPDGHGNCEVDVQTKTTCPAFQPPKTIAKIDLAAGGLMFNPDLPGNPNQSTIADVLDEDDK